MQRHVHIGYGDSATGCLLEAMENHGLPGDNAIPSRDDFTQGPISECLSDKGTEQRISYWESIEKELKFGMDVRPFYIDSIQLLNEIKADEVTLWIGDSCHDILGTGWILNYFRNKEIKFYSIDLAIVKLEDMPEDKPVVNLAMYTPKQIPNLWKYRKVLSHNEIAYYFNTFNKASEENSFYRIQDGENILSVGEDFFDDYILSHVHDYCESCTNVIGRILKDGSHRISDTTVEWNIKKMIKRGRIDHFGELNSMHNYDIMKINPTN